MVVDEVVNHFQPVEKGFFIERLPPEMEADRVQNFFVFEPSEVGPLSLFVVFFEACHISDYKSENSQSCKHNRVQGNAPCNCRRDDGLSSHHVAKQVFSLKAVKELFVAPIFLVVESVKLFQHLDGVPIKGGVNVVEVKHT